MTTVSSTSRDSSNDVTLTRSAGTGSGGAGGTLIITLLLRMHFLISGSLAALGSVSIIEFLDLPKIGIFCPALIMKGRHVFLDYGFVLLYQSELLRSKLD